MHYPQLPLLESWVRHQYQPVFPHPRGKPRRTLPHGLSPHTRSLVSPPRLASLAPPLYLLPLTPAPQLGLGILILVGHALTAPGFLTRREHLVQGLP